MTHKGAPLIELTLEVTTPRSVQEIAKTAGINMTNISKEPFESHYVIQKELGRGKFATVYQAQKRSTKEIFAAKIILTKSPKNMEESLNEVEILRSVDHVGIVKCHDVFQARNSLTIILELIGGGELFEKLANEDHVSEGQAASYCKQVLEALDYLHGVKIAHLDLKPENLMLSASDSDVIKLVDFGLAKRLNKRVVCMQGTPEFVPPEIISLDPLGTYSDMWSVGVIVYIMVSGYSPFMGDDDMETYGNITACEYEFYEDGFENVSEDCKDFIRSLLQPKPADRLSAVGALNHNWVVKRMENKNSIENQKIKRFLAQRKWRTLHKTIVTARIFNSILGRKNAPQEKAAAPSVSMDHRKLMVTEGDSVSITAHVISVKPTCSWSKDGIALTENKEKINVLQSDNQSVLVVTAFTKQDEGNYTIACTNPAGTSTASVQLLIQKPTAPFITFDKFEFEGYEGESVELYADLIADPKPSVCWQNKKKTDLVKKSERFTAKLDQCSATLKITKLKLTDGGNYTLKARNKFGPGAASCQLKVLPRRTELSSVQPDSDTESPMESKPKEGIILQNKKSSSGKVKIEKPPDKAKAAVLVTDDKKKTKVKSPSQSDKPAKGGTKTDDAESSKNGTSVSRDEGTTSNLREPPTTHAQGIEHSHSLDESKTSDNEKDDDTTRIRINSMAAVVGAKSLAKNKDKREGKKEGNWGLDTAFDKACLNTTFPLINSYHSFTPLSAIQPPSTNLRQTKSYSAFYPSFNLDTCIERVLKRNMHLKILASYRRTVNPLGSGTSVTVEHDTNIEDSIQIQKSNFAPQHTPPALTMLPRPPRENLKPVLCSTRNANESIMHTSYVKPQILRTF